MVFFYNNEPFIITYYNLFPNSSLLFFALSITSGADHVFNLALSLKETALIVEKDHHSSFKQIPELWDLYGDHGIIYQQFELWDSIVLYTYDELKENAIKEGFLVTSLEKLLLLCNVRGVYDTRYLEDAKLVAKALTTQNYDGFDDNTINTYWKLLLHK